MISFKKAQSIALWFHIPLWVAVAFVVVIIGAYHQGIRNAEAKTAQMEAQSAFLPILTLKQLIKIPVSDL